MTDQQSPSDLSPPEGFLQVSIASAEQRDVPTALDEVLDRLSAVTKSEVSTLATALYGPERVLKLIGAICGAPTRRAAVETLVRLLDADDSDTRVRAGLGRERLDHLYDPHLGWLGPESSLHQQLSSRWTAMLVGSETSADPVPRMSRDSQAIAMLLPQPNGDRVCAIWIEGEAAQSGTSGWTSSALQALNFALWSRPARRVPMFVTRVAANGRVTAGIVAVVVAIVALWPVKYRIACHARVETTAQRLISTPFEATLLRSSAKPGDVVRAGDLLFELDGRPLRLERESIEAEHQQVAKEHDSALATGRIAEAQQSTLKQKQLARRSELIKDRLNRLEVVSPIDGVVVSGDLERYVGAPLERGQTLIEVAPMRKMVIEIEIPEHEIAYVRDNAETRVKIDALGGKSIRMPLSDLYPSAELRDQRNVFVGRIEIDNGDGKLRPGMLGEATTYGPLRPWCWSWVRNAWERTLWWMGY